VVELGRSSYRIFSGTFFFLKDFPARLFSNMDKADQVGWGGSTVTSGNAAAPPMGSGHFPDNKLMGCPPGSGGGRFTPHMMNLNAGQVA
jgi:hypothetical protein